MQICSPPIPLPPQFIQPLQKRIKSDSRTLPKMESDFQGMSKSFKNDLKKASQGTIKAQKQAKKGKADSLEAALESLDIKSKEYESFNQRCLRSVLIEERRRYAYLVRAVRNECSHSAKTPNSHAMFSLPLSLSLSPLSVQVDSYIAVFNMDLMGGDADQTIMFVPKQLVPLHRPMPTHPSLLPPQRHIEPG